MLEPARDKCAHGGRGSGKSHFFAGLMVEDCLAEPGNNGGEGMRAVCIREIQKDLAQSAKLLIETKLVTHGLGEADGFKVYEDRITTPGDGLIIFKGMNNYTSDSIKSLEGFKRSWWEEAHTATRKSINLLRPTMRTKGSQMWWSYNPTLKSDPVDVMFRGEETPTGSIVVQANWRDNPWFTEELEQERRDCLRIQPDQYEHIWEGGYVTVASGAYFSRHLAEAKAKNHIGRVEFDPLMKVRLFVDIGGTGARADAFAMWPAQFIGKEIRVRDYYEAVGQPLATHLNWLRSMNYGPERAEFWLPHDGASNDKVFSVSYESALRQAGYKVTIVPNQGKGAAAARIEAARRVFPSVWFDADTTEAGRDALGWYHEKRDEARNIGLGPNHDWSSHACFTADTQVLTRYGMCQISKLPETGEILTPCGWKRYIAPRITRKAAPLVEVAFADGHTVRCTPDHLFLTESGWKSAESLEPSLQIRSSLTLSRSISTAAYIVSGRAKAITRAAARSFTAMFGRMLSAQFRGAATFTTATAIQATTRCPISNAWTDANTYRTLGTQRGTRDRLASLMQLETPPPSGIVRRLGGSGTSATPNAQRVGLNGSANRANANIAERPSTALSAQTGISRSIAAQLARLRRIASAAKQTLTPLRIAHVRPLNETADVWDITVPSEHCFSLANGAVVHNCDAFGMMCVAYKAPAETKTKQHAPSGSWMGR